MNIDKSNYIRMLIFQLNSLKKAIERTLDDRETNVSGRYSSFKTYAAQFNNLADNVCGVLNLPREGFGEYDLDKIPGWANTVWPQQRQIVESVLLDSDILLSYLEAATEFADDEFSVLEAFLKTKLRPTIFSKPTKEIEIQNAIESLFIGKGWSKGIDYDRETGKVSFSGKEYIPDFIVPKTNLCIEVKLLREGKRSEVIEQINADIVGYGKKYERQLFVVYDLGVIRDELEFIRDIENSGDSIRVVVVKH